MPSVKTPVVLGYVALLAIIVVLVGVIVALAPSGPNAHSSPPSGRPHGVPAGAAEAVVVDHVDGDTIKVRSIGRSRYLTSGDVTTVRLLEIDTPESVDPNEPVQCYARRADHALSRLLPLGARVWVEPDHDLLDQYGRTLLYLWTTRGTFVNLALVRHGFARAVLYEPNDQHIGLMRAAERRARAVDRGLWGACRYFGQPAR